MKASYKLSEHDWSRKLKNYTDRRRVLINKRVWLPRILLWHRNHVECEIVGSVSSNQYIRSPAEFLLRGNTSRILLEIYPNFSSPDATHFVWKIPSKWDRKLNNLVSGKWFCVGWLRCNCIRINSSTYDFKCFIILNKFNTFNNYSIFNKNEEMSVTWAERIWRRLL